MREVFGLFLMVFLVSCSKEEVVPLVDESEVECGCEYTHFKSGIPDEVRRRALSPEYFSMDNLVSVFIHYLNTGNRAGLESLLITRDEFTNWIFPEYNIANPNCNIQPEMIYNSLANKSIEGMDHMESEFFYRDLEFVKLEISNPHQEEDFESYAFFNRTLIHVKTIEGSEIIGMTGTMVSLNNRFKLLSYRENNHLPG